MTDLACDLGNYSQLESRSDFNSFNTQEGRERKRNEGMVRKDGGKETEKEGKKGRIERRDGGRGRNVEERRREESKERESIHSEEPE